MAYVTDDPRVREILKRVRAGIFSRVDAATEIKALPPQKGSDQGYLDWEVSDALDSLKRAG